VSTIKEYRFLDFYYSNNIFHAPSKSLYPWPLLKSIFQLDFIKGGQTMGKAIVITVFGVLMCLCVLGCLSRGAIKVNERPQAKIQNISYSGGNGTSHDSAIVLSGGRDHSAAVESEHKFISRLFGEQDKDWKVAEQSMVSDSGKTFDMVQVESLKTGEKHFYYFDITWYAKKAKRPQNVDDAR
jgi:hypothetical protein